MGPGFGEELERVMINALVAIGFFILLVGIGTGGM